MNSDTEELWYKITPETGRELYVHNYYVIHIPFISTNGYSGISPVSVLHDTIEYAENIKKVFCKAAGAGSKCGGCFRGPGEFVPNRRKWI